jgi:hypothetical protein
MAAIPRRVTCHVGRAACERGPGGPTASGVTLPALLATGMALRQAADRGHAAGGPLIFAPGDGQSRASRHPPGARRRARTPHHPPGHETGAAPRRAGHGGRPPHTSMPPVHAPRIRGVRPDPAASAAGAGPAAIEACGPQITGGGLPCTGPCPRPGLWGAGGSCGVGWPRTRGS